MYWFMKNSSIKFNYFLGAAWWSMASHLAAQDYLARFQASGLNFASLGNPADLQYSSLGMHTLGSHHKSSKNTKSSAKGSSKDKLSAAALSAQAGSKLDVKTSVSMSNSKAYTSNNNSSKYTSSSGLTIQPSMPGACGDKKSSKMSDLSYLKSLEKIKCSGASSSVKSTSQQPGSCIFTSPLSLASNSDKSNVSTHTTQSSLNSSVASLPSSILR